MGLQEQKNIFDQNISIIENAILTFHGVDGYDVYNCSLPFTWEGKRYIFGRVERRGEWMRSWVRLFEETGLDHWTLVENSMIYQLEDPYIAIIHGELIMGGTHVRVKGGKLDTYYAYFYRGTKVDDLHYFTTGPDYMKDIRLVELTDGRIGVFSRPRNDEIKRKYGSESMIGFSIINNLEELTGEVVENAPLIEGLFQPGEWGGCNQVYLLPDGKLGVLGHFSYLEDEVCGEESVSVYTNMAFVFNPITREVENLKMIGTRKSYPEGPAKLPHLCDCAFTSGMVSRLDGMVDLYSGIGDCMEGRTVIPYPF
ncbi:DUF1861 family protein [Lachnospiraceae bacterium OttesenSCG-928-D06]|nr:DUF1861 family protein [Lachnospiraceae bacterium OttesenSCG-928-D06]